MRNMLPLMQLMDRLVPDATVRPKVLAAAVATTVSYGLSVPSSQVEMPAVHYTSSLFTGVMETLSDVNEKIVFDIKYAEQVVRGIWTVRYQAVHLPAGCFTANSDNFFCSMFGVNRAIPEADQAMLTKYSVEIAQASMLLQSLMRDD